MGWEHRRSKYGFRPTNGNGNGNEKDHDVTVAAEVQIDDAGEVVELAEVEVTDDSSHRMDGVWSGLAQQRDRPLS